MKTFMNGVERTISGCIILIFSLLLVSCAQAGMADQLVGSLALSAEFPTTGSKTTGTTVSEDDIASYQLFGSGPDGYSLQRENPSLPWVLSRLPIGEWTMTLDALDDDGTILLAGTKEIDVASGNLTKATFSLSVPGYEKQVASPVFSPATSSFSGTTNVTLSCDTDGATIYYTNDGSTPTNSSTLYEGAIVLTATTTLKAIAVKEGMDDSKVVSAVYTKASQVAIPSISPAGGTIIDSQSVAITCSTSGATIHYTTDGSTPTNSSTLYEGAIVLTATTTLKAIAVKEGMDDSEVVSAVYTRASQVAIPSISPEGGTIIDSQGVAITCGTSGATIHYTTDGSTPTVSSATYVNAFTLTSATTVKAIAVKEGMIDSEIAEATFVAQGTVATPIITPSGGSFSGSRSVTITCSTDGATIHYTTDGTIPSSGSDTYVEPITFTSDGTLKAIAVKDGMIDSAIVTETYTLGRSVTCPVMTPVGGTYQVVQSVTITCSTTDAVIHYTTDGTAPTASSLLYEEALTVDTSQTVKAIAMKTGLNDSTIASNTYVLKVITPVFTKSDTTFSGSTTVGISCDTSGAIIRYTTDGSTPTASSNLYTTPISISSTTTVKAIAVKDDWENSDAISATYTKRDVTSTPLITSSAISKGMQVAITCSTSGATIHYTTDGSTPTATSTTYVDAFTVTVDTTVKALAIKDGLDDSTVASTTISITQVSTPSITVADGTGGQSVTITCSTSGAIIYYTTDGSTPSVSSTKYSSAFILVSGKTVNAYAIKSGMVDSTVASKSVTVSQVVTPSISPDSGSFSGSQEVTISCTTSGASIYYTTDGTAPSASSIKYNSAFTLTNGATVKAYAVKSGMADSAVADETYTLMQTITTPVITIFDVAGGQSVTITCSTSGATIYYTTDGTTPSVSSTKYGSAFTLVSSKTVKAYAVKSGMTDSAVASKSVTVSQVVTPSITVADGTGGQSVTLTCSTSGATIYYTTDGTTPSASSTKYSSAFILVSGKTVNAYAIKSGMTDSAVASKSVTVSQVVTPSISPDSGSFRGSQVVTITCSTSGASIYYTTDGSTPSASSTKYTSAFTLTSGATVKAYAVKSGMADSAVASKTYSLMMTVATPVITASDVTGGQSVTLTCSTSGAIIYYTTDGSTPSVSSTKYSSAFTLTSGAAIKAYAVKSGMVDSVVASKSVTVSQVATPSIAVADGTGGQSVTLTCSTSGATIYYTTDGTVPSTSSTKYNSAFILVSGKTVNAYAVKSGMIDSTVVSKSVTVSSVATPSISPDSGSFSGSQVVTITCSTSGASIYYTIDGSTPSASSTKYGSAFTLASSKTVKAVAVKSGMADSTIASKTYSLMTTVAMPVITASDITGGQSVVITCSTSGATIYYTTDGTAPSTSSTKFSSAFTLTTSKTVKAYAVKSDMTDSTVASKNVTVSSVATPVITASDVTGGQSVTITCSTSGATIYYTTDGTAPSTSSTKYSSAFTLVSSKTIKAYAVKSGMVDSTVASKSVTVSSVATPSISPDSGSFSGSQVVTITCSTSGATIYYTTDGSTPTVSSTKYTSAFTLASSKTVKAYAVKSGMVDSAVADETYTLVTLIATPVFSPVPAAGETYDDAQTVTITCDTAGATIHYTTASDDNVPSNPTASSTEYTGAITVSETTTIKAIATKDGMQSSAIVTEKYVINGSIVIEI